LEPIFTVLLTGWTTDSLTVLPDFKATVYPSIRRIDGRLGWLARLQVFVQNIQKRLTTFRNGRFTPFMSAKEIGEKEA
jgi:hypothetical protein